MAAPLPATSKRVSLENPALRFGLVASAWIIVFLGVLRLRAVQTLVVLPFTQLQGHIAAWHLGQDQLPVVVGLECSGTDVLALAFAVTLAYPVAWSARLAGAVFALLWLTGLNIVRLASLGLAVGTSAFVPLHIQIWPAVLMVSALAYLAGWIWVVDRRAMRSGDSLTGALTRFAVWATGLVVVFQAVSPWLLESGAMVTLSRLSAAAAGAVLGALGASVVVSGPVINTSHGAFLVTPECITTPLMPIYLAAVMALSLPTTHRLAALLAFGPLFAALVIGRLLTVALPPIFGASTFILTHAFHQVVLAAIVVGVVSWHGHTGRAPGRLAARAVLAGALGLIVAAAGGGLYARLIGAGAELLTAVAPHTMMVGVSSVDLQGAWYMLPAFHLGLSVALLAAWPGPQRVSRWILALVLSGAATLGALAVAGELGAHARIVVPTVVVRGWAIVAPVFAVLGAAWLTTGARR